jgi:hypothetical protein
MAIQETLFCSMTEAIYDALVALIEMGLTIPVQFLNSIKSFIRKVELLILTGIESSLETIERKLFAFLDATKLNPDTSEQKNNFCALLFSCDALRESLFDPDDTTGESDATFVKFMGLEIRNQIRAGYYDVFEKYVCKLSLRAMIDNFIDFSLLSVADQLSELRLTLLDALNINTLVDEYEDLLETEIGSTGKSIYNMLDDMDKFSQCAFGACNFINTSSNQQEDFAAKLFIEKIGDEWVVNLTELTYEMDMNGEILLNTIDELLAFANRTEEKTDGISTSSIMLS